MGRVNWGSIVLILMAVITATIAFNIFPTLLTGADSVRTNVAATNYTGLVTVVQVGPTILFVAMVFGALVSMFFGIKGAYGSMRG